MGLGAGFASPRLGPERLKGCVRIVSCLGRHSGYHPRFITLPAARPRARALRPLGLVVPSERLWATLQPRSGGSRAPRTLEGRADRSSAPAGSCLSAMGGPAAPGACAAWAARARLWERASTTREDPAPPSTTALHRPSDASRSEPIAGRRGRAGPAQRRTAGHSAGFGQGVSRALGTPRPTGCVAGQPRTVPPRPADASRAARIAGGEVELALPCGEGTLSTQPPRPELQPITGGGEELSGRGCVQAAPHPPAKRPRRMGLHERVRTHPYTALSPASPSPGAPRSGSRPPSAVRKR